MALWEFTTAWKSIERPDSQFGTVPLRESLPEAGTHAGEPSGQWDKREKEGIKLPEH